MERDMRIDSWKGVLIFLVVLGHVIGMAVHFSNGVVNECLEYAFKLIYVFHMPAFFFLAGMTWHKNEGEAFGAFVLKKSKRLLVPYFIFGIFSGLFFLILCSNFEVSMSARDGGYYKNISGANVRDMIVSLFHAGGLPQNGVFRGNSVLWFLPAFFLAEVFYWIIEKYFSKIRVQLILMVIIFCIGFFLPPLLPWGITRVMQLLPFLIIGRCCKNYIFYLQKNVFIVGLFIFYIFACYWTPNHWIVHSSFLWYLLFGVLSLIGIVVSLKVAVVFHKWAYIREIGFSTMGIMLTHKYVIVFFQSKLPIVGTMCQNGVGSVVVVLVVACLAMVCALFVSKFVERKFPAMLGRF